MRSAGNKIYEIKGTSNNWTGWILSGFRKKTCFVNLSVATYQVTTENLQNTDFSEPPKAAGNNY